MKGSPLHLRRFRSRPRLIAQSLDRHAAKRKTVHLLPFLPARHGLGEHLFGGAVMAGQNSVLDDARDLRWKIDSHKLSLNRVFIVCHPGYLRQPRQTSRYGFALRQVNVSVNLTGTTFGVESTCSFDATSNVVTTDIE